MNGTVRAIGRLAAALAVVVTVAGLLAGGAAAEGRPEAQSANDEIAFCVSQGGDADAWIGTGGVIGVSCEFDDYTVFCQYSADNPDGRCVIIDPLVAYPGTGGTQSPTVPRGPVFVPDETRA